MTKDPDLAALEAEIEATRQRLAGNIDQLAYRISPKTIARREAYVIKAYFVDVESGAPRTDNILKVVGGFAGFVGALVVIRKVTR